MATTAAPAPQVDDLGHPADWDTNYDSWCRHCGAQIITGYDGMSGATWRHIYPEGSAAYLASGNANCKEATK